MGKLYKRPSKLRRSTPKSGKEVQIPPGVDMEAGDDIEMYYNGFVLIVPKGTEVDEKILEKIVKLPQKGK